MWEVYQVLEIKVIMVPSQNVTQLVATTNRNNPGTICPIYMKIGVLRVPT